jgi:hypothetical protein
MTPICRQIRLLSIGPALYLAFLWQLRSSLRL